MADGRRWRRAPLTKVPHHNVFRVNLDLRSGSPRATLLKPPHPALQVPLYHPQGPHTATQAFADTLDAPPKYEDIFRGGVHGQVPHQRPQQDNRGSYEKKRIKSYLLRHLPKARAPAATNKTNNNTSSSSGRSGRTRRRHCSVKEEGDEGREGCYAQINIPPTTPLEYRSSPSPGAPSPKLHYPQPDQHQFVGPEEMGLRQDHHVQDSYLEEECAGEGGGGSRSFTITLKPGRYRVNVQWRSKTHPFRITLTPNKKRMSEAPPPTEQQPLYYNTCEAHQEQHATPSLPRRLVHRLLAHRPPSPTRDCNHHHHHHHEVCPAQLPSLQEQLVQHQHSLLQQQVGVNPAACGNRQGLKRCWDGVTPRHRQRKSRYRLAERKKNEGNDLYKAKEYREALKLYTQAIDLCPDCAAYYSNRSACYMMLGKYTEALNDAREAVRLDKSFVKGYLRVAKCNIALGDATAAQSVLRQATELDPANRSIREEAARAQNLLRCQEEVAKATGKADYRTAIFHLDRALELAVGCRTLKITKAEYLVFLHRYPDAQEIVNEILQFDSGNADAIYVRGMCLYYQDNPDAAFHHFQQVLRLAPDHHKARQVYKKAKLLKQKKEEGNDAFKRGSYQEAYTCYTDALAIDPLNRHTNAKLYFNRATVGSKINKVDEAVEDCTAAINLDERYVKAYLRRAKCYQQLEKHEEAVRDYEKVSHLDRSQEHKRLLQEAKIQLKRSKRKDYYKILGVSKTATEDEIKKSYRKMALVHHPDRHANASDKDKHEHEVKFKEIGEAYSVLTDGKKRAMYDRGHDLNDPDGGFPHEEFDPNQIFQAFFGGGGGGGGHGGYTFGNHSGGFPQGGFPGSGFSGSSSFPGGFHFQFG